MRQSIDAYLDIETTGLFVSCDDITVIGIYLYNSGNSRLIQLIGAEATGDNLLEALEGVSTIFTYNGSRFDLPFIYAYLGVDLTDLYQHHDLMYDCWRENLYGGFKAVEVQLGIPRQLKDIGGFEAIMLWRKYQNHNDQDALALLLEYNREDVINLKTLREKLFPEAD
jgi:uncharacterized protein YprB with RNaseH-like and TPR domain